MAFISRKNKTVWSIALVALAIGALFNSCSDVKFNSISESSNGEQGDWDPPPVCYGNDCPAPKQFVNYADTLTVPKRTQKTDVMLVLDDSGSMNLDLRKLAERLNGLIQILENGGIDWQMCFITTYVGDSGLAGKAQPWKVPQANGGTTLGGKVLSSTTPNKEGIFLATMGSLVGDNRGDEQGINALRMAVLDSQNADCFRSDASLNSIIISDEDERSCGGRFGAEPGTSRVDSACRNLATENNPSGLVDLLRGKTFVNHSIVIRKNDPACFAKQDYQSVELNSNSIFAHYGVEYGKLQSMTGGVLGDICAASYADQLKVMGARAIETLNSVTLKCSPVAGSVKLTLTPAIAGLTWRMEGNKVLFSSPVPESTRLDVKYTCIQ